MFTSHQRKKLEDEQEIFNQEKHIRNKKAQQNNMKILSLFCLLYAW